MSLRIVPTVSLVVFVACHVVECILRVPLMWTAPDMLTRAQPMAFLLGYIVLCGFYLIAYVRGHVKRPQSHHTP